MFSRVFLICSLAFVASAYQIGGYLGEDVPQDRYGGYQIYLRLIRGGYPYGQGYGSFDKSYYPYGYASRYYGPAAVQEGIYGGLGGEYQEQVYPYYQQYYKGYYPEYISNWWRYPYYAKYFQQQYYDQPRSVYPLSYYQDYEQQYQKYPYYDQQYYGRVPYYGSYSQYPYYRSYGGYQTPYTYPLLNRILGYQNEYVY